MEFNLNYKQNQIDEIKDMIFNVIVSKIDRIINQPEIEGARTREPVTFDDRLSLTYRPYAIGESWGDLFDCAWFRISGKVERRIRNVYLRLDVSGEACLFDETGTPAKGFTNGSSAYDRHHGEPGKHYYVIDRWIREDGTFDLWVDAAANDLFGTLQNQGEIISCELVERDPKILELFYDLEVLLNMLEVFDQSLKAHQELFDALREIYYLVIYEKSGWLEKALKRTKPFFQKRTTSKMVVYATGHAHIDLAWLWPIRETKRKAGRTIANVLYLLEKHPDFVFGISQPQLLTWVETAYPKLFERMRKYIQAGRIELQGGMWVEADTNLSGGESLIRQFYYGMTYYKDTFGETVDNLWLPDVFGYQGNLPQLIKGVGLNYFMTTKLSWSLINRFPHHTFVWRGIDGSEVICHMPPEGTYNSSIKPQALHYMENHYIEKNDIPFALNLYGIGDGGGGPGDEHLERIHRVRDLDPLPKVKLTQAKELFAKLSTFRDRMKTYEGELYLENHQGTLTSHTKVKRYNRFLENKLKTIEQILTLNKTYQRHRHELDEIWKEYLLYQFHDILPGSSISRVYVECLKGYETIDQKLDDMIKSDFPAYTHSIEEGKPYNPSLNEVEILVRQKNAYKRQTIAGLSNRILSEQEYVYGATSNETRFETNRLIIEFSEETGFIERIYHKNLNRELLERKFANVLCVYKDLGDAWNIMMHYREQDCKPMKLNSRTVHHFGKIKEVVQSYAFKRSTLQETIVIDYENDRIDFKHSVDWRDSGYMLRTNFPLDIKTQEATFDIQFGEIVRTRNTEKPVDRAKFEVCGHNWLSMNEGRLGVSLINDGKYGFSVQNDRFDMNLLRSTTYPAIDQDIGKTSHAYALIIHDGDHHTARIDDIAQTFNDFMPLFRETVMFEPVIMFDSDHVDHVLLKDSYDQKGIVVRLNEKSGLHGKIEIEWPKWATAVYETNLVEKEDRLIDSNMIDFGPYEIKTFKIISCFQ